MTTRAQLHKTALGLPGTKQDGSDPLSFSVSGRQFATLNEAGQLLLPLDEDTVRTSLKHCTITRLPPAGDQSAMVSLPLDELNGMELNNLVFKAWLTQAPAGLADRARAAVRGEAPDGPDALPRSIGSPALRALLLAGITSLGQVAAHSEEQLLALHGVGPRAVRILKEVLLESGRQLADHPGG